LLLQGSRFSPDPAALANFVSALIPPEKFKNGWLPGFTARDVCPIAAIGILDPLSATIDVSNVETFPEPPV
jgi:hypothetical protein